MVLIFSEEFDPSTNMVRAWLLHNNKKSLRINTINAQNEAYSFQLSNIDKTQNSNFRRNSNKYSINDIKAVWYRRTPNIFPNIIINRNKELENEISENISNENYSVYHLFYLKLDKIPRLGNPQLNSLRKVNQLTYAIKNKLIIPETIITNNKKDLIVFKKKTRKIIIKPIYNNTPHYIEGKVFAPYTTVLTQTEIKRLNDNFHPCLAQKYIEKEFEVRCFYLDSKFYSMAIFSQSDKQTSVDFKNFNDSHPNRTVPYKLPNEMENKLDTFMKDIGLNTGSIDIIVNKKGEHVFLEVNPVGQFGMVSGPCNYYLEHEIAKYLIKNEEK